jgi:hypothetical protein
MRQSTAQSNSLTSAPFMMALLDDVDGVDLQIAQMLYGAKGRVAPSPNDARSSRRWA